MPEEQGEWQSTPFCRDEAQRDMLAVEVMSLYRSIRHQGGAHVRGVEIRVLMQDGSAAAVYVVHRRKLNALSVMTAEHFPEPES